MALSLCDRKGCSETGEVGTHRACSGPHQALERDPGGDSRPRGIRRQLGLHSASHSLENGTAAGLCRRSTWLLAEDLLRSEIPASICHLSCASCVSSKYLADLLQE